MWQVGQTLEGFAQCRTGWEPAPPELPVDFASPRLGLTQGGRTPSATDAPSELSGIRHTWSYAAEPRYQQRHVGVPIGE
jgi:hypothetical protein